MNKIAEHSYDELHGVSTMLSQSVCWSQPWGAKTAEAIEMPFAMSTRVGPRHHPGRHTNVVAWNHTGECAIRGHLPGHYEV